MKRHAVAIAAVVALFHLCTLRPGHAWGDDFAMYILHARNLATGLPYGLTGFLLNPHHPLGPAAYPPVFPMLLAPIYALRGLDLEAMKWVGIAAFAASLLPLHCLALRELSLRWAAALMVIVGLHPFFWQFKHHVLSDLPFLLWVLIALALAERAAASDDGPRAIRWRGALIGAVCYLAYGTRSVGALLPAALALQQLWRHRRPSPWAFTALSVFAGLALLQHTLMPVAGSGYLQYWHFSPDTIVRQVGWYLSMLCHDLWGGGAGNLSTWMLSALTGAFAITGYRARLRALDHRTPGVVEIFVPVYAAVLIWPHYQGTRMLIPVVPLIIFYAAIGLRRFTDPLPPGARRAMVCAALLAIGGTYAARYSRLDYEPIRPGVTEPRTQALFRYVREQVPQDAVCVFWKPRALALFTGRRSAVARYDAGETGIWEDLARFKATHVIVYRRHGPDATILQPALKRAPQAARQAYANGEFVLYEVRPNGPRAP